MTFCFYILFLLSGLTGTDGNGVTTVRKVSVKAGQCLSIPCLYDKQYRNHVKYLCKGYYWNSCSYVIKTNERQRSNRFSISDYKDQRIFTVTMRELTNKDSDFWCAVEINSGPDDREYFHLSVTTGTPILNVNDQEITGFVGENVSIRFQNSISERIKWCRFGGSCVANPSGFIDGTRVTINKTDPKVFIVTMSELKPESGGWYLCEAADYQMPVHVNVIEKPTTTEATAGATVKLENEDGTSFDLQTLIIPLSVLVAIVIVVLIIWLLLRRKRTIAEVTIKAGDEVTYSSVVDMKQNLSQRSHDERQTTVLYSSVVTRKKQNTAVTTPAGSDGDVVYSSVVGKQQDAKKTGTGAEATIYSTVAEHS